MAIKDRNISILGSDLTGSDGAVNRTYTLTPGAGATVSAGSIKIHAAGSYLYEGSHYTYTSNVITFLVNMDDTDAIDISWNDITTDGLSGSYYTDAKNMVIFGGFGVLVVDESLGTGDGTELDYDLKNGNVIDDSYSLYYGASGSNSMTDLVEGTHYSIDLDAGRILLTSSGATELGTNVLYAKYIHSPKISNSFLNQFIPQIQAEVDAITGNTWGEATTYTEYFDGRRTSEYPTTDAPFATDWDEPDFIELKYKGINSITSLQFLDKTGTATDTLTSSDYTFDPNGTVTLYSKRIPNGTRNVKVVYVQGYSTINPLITKLASAIGGVMIAANITGGSYDDVTRFSMGRKDVSIGEVYVNVAEVVKQFERIKEQVLDAIGRKNDLFVI
jgi:hypothetical protein